MLMRRVVRFALPAGACLLSIVCTAADDTVAPAPPDTRAAKLKSFFQSHDCPAPYHIGEYLRAADVHSIDYRLLPALSVRESTCGRYQRLNNFWGWDSARSGFESVEKGIDAVARHLAEGRYYRGKTLKEKLSLYNPYPSYTGEVLSLMREIDKNSGSGSAPVAGLD